MSPAVPQPVSNKDTKTTYAASKDMARPFQITEHQPVMVSDKDLKIVGACAQLQRAPLCAKDMDQFDTWKEDILRAVQSVLLTGREHWVTVNRLITTRLDEDVYQTVTSFFPDDDVGFEALDPKELLKRIEERL